MLQRIVLSVAEYN